MDIREYLDTDEAAVISLWRDCGLVVPHNDPAKDIARKLAVGRDLFLVGTTDEGIVSRLDLKSGDEVWSDRLRGHFSASPIFVDGRIYFFSEMGDCFVLKPGDRFELLATNKLESGFMASPAVAGKAIYARSKTHIYRIEQR